MASTTRTVGGLAILLLSISSVTSGQAPGGLPSTSKGDWIYYNADLTGSKYSPLEQITAANFNKLEVAWRFKTDALGPRPEFNFQGTPLMVNGVVYSTAGSRRAVVALDAGTGEMLWMHSENEGKRGESAPRQLSGRGLAYWSDGRDARVVYVTPGYRMIALDAKTGVPSSLYSGRGPNASVLNRHATSSLLKLAALICSSGEYLLPVRSAL